MLLLHGISVDMECTISNLRAAPCFTLITSPRLIYFGSGVRQERFYIISLKRLIYRQERDVPERQSSPVNDYIPLPIRALGIRRGHMHEYAYLSDRLWHALNIADTLTTPDPTTPAQEPLGITYTGSNASIGAFLSSH